MGCFRSITLFAVGVVGVLVNTSTDRLDCSKFGLKYVNDEYTMDALYKDVMAKFPKNHNPDEKWSKVACAAPSLAPLFLLEFGKDGIAPSEYWNEDDLAKAADAVQEMDVDLLQQRTDFAKTYCAKTDFKATRFCKSFGLTVLSMKKINANMLKQLMITKGKFESKDKIRIDEEKVNAFNAKGVLTQEANGFRLKRSISVYAESAAAEGKRWMDELKLKVGWYGSKDGATKDYLFEFSEIEYETFPEFKDNTDGVLRMKKNNPAVWLDHVVKNLGGGTTSEPNKMDCFFQKIKSKKMPLMLRAYGSAPTLLAYYIEHGMACAIWANSEIASRNIIAKFTPEYEFTGIIAGKDKVGKYAVLEYVDGKYVKDFVDLVQEPVDDMIVAAFQKWTVTYRARGELHFLNTCKMETDDSTDTIVTLKKH